MKEKGWLFLTVKLQLPNVEGMKMIDDHNWANITIIILIIKNLGGFFSNKSPNKDNRKHRKLLLCVYNRL